MLPRNATASRASRQFDFHRVRREAYAHVTAQQWREARAALRQLSGDRRFGGEDWQALAVSCFRLGDYDGMAAAAAKAVALDPGDVRAVHMLTTALCRQHRFRDALPWFERYVDHEAAANYHFLSNYGATLSHLREHARAADAFLRALVLKPEDPAIHMKLGLELRSMKLYQEAAESFVTATVLDPRRFVAQLMVMHMRQFACSWQDFDERSRLVVDLLREMGEDEDLAGEGGVWALTAVDCPPDLVLKAARQMARKAAAGVEPFPARAVPARQGRRIRVGYVSADFNSHATAMLLVEALEHRDRDQFEVILYCHSRDDGTAMRRRVLQACDRHVDISAMSDAEAARRIHADEVDILVDLKGHTAGGRFRLFAYRAAPIQVSFLGYPGSTGADYVDYVIGDPVVTPLSHAPYYSEAIAQMPHSYQPNDSQRTHPEPLSRAEAGLPKGVPVLCNFNQTFKQSPRALDSWARIMHAVPDSVLWMLGDHEQARRNLLREVEARGIAPSRVVFADRVGVAWHLARLPAADLMVDNWPCNAHTTASEMLWMGVPVVTMMGDTFASRVAASLLHAVGLGELACTSVAEYEARAIELLTNRQRLQSVRDHLAAVRTTTPLFDGRRFAADLERLYARMVDLAAAGRPPEALPAEAGD